LKKILHITSHLGGGVGAVVTTLVSESEKLGRYKHIIISLDSISEYTYGLVEELNIEIKSNLTILEILEFCDIADIIQIEWWNHPLINRLLYNLELKKSRVIIYSHISGFFSPSVFTKEVINFCDKFILTTPFSLEHELIKKQEKEKIETIPSLSGTVLEMDNVKHVEDKIFNVLYVGTVDFSKIHENFVRMHAEVKVPNIRFDICGGQMQKILEKQVKMLSKESLFNFHGFVNNVANFFSKADVFGYPLCKEHYGTGEQVLLEAMSAGVVPVVFDNGAEKYIIENNKTGIIVSSEQEYTNAIEYLYHNPNIRKELSINARKYAKENLNIKIYAQKFNDIYDNLIMLPKRDRKFKNPKICNNEKIPFGSNLFLTFLGSFRKIFEKSIILENIYKTIDNDFAIIMSPESMKSKTKGSVFHYLSFFNDDNCLLFWAGLLKMKNNESSHAEALIYFKDAVKNGFTNWRIYIYIYLLEEISDVNSYSFNKNKIVDWDVYYYTKRKYDKLTPKE